MPSWLSISGALLLAGTISAMPTVPAVPKIVSSFHADMKMTTIPAGFSLCAYSSAADCGSWSVSQDDQLKRMVQTQFFKNRFAPAEFKGTSAEWTNFTIQMDGSSSKALFNLSGACYDDFFPGTYHDMFAWTPLAQYGGTVPGECADCQLWLFNTSAVSFRLLARGNLPVQMNITTDQQGKQQIQVLDFSNFTAGPDPHAAVLNRTACSQPPVCEPEAGVVNKSMYLFHPAHQLNISGQDVGDALGDSFFLCEDLMLGRNPTMDHNYAWLTHWQVEHLAQYGQYQNCNGYPPDCKGGNNWLVGKEAAIGLGVPLAGQCTDNQLTGNWWSLPVGGHCGPNQTIPSDCTWRGARVKTIDGTCLLKQHSLLDKCKVDGIAPFKTAHEAFEKAFSSDDIADGGCPPLVVTS